MFMLACFCLCVYGNLPKYANPVCANPVCFLSSIAHSAQRGRGRAEAKRAPARPRTEPARLLLGTTRRESLTSTERTVTKGAVNFAQIRVSFAKTISQVCTDLRTFHANFTQIRSLSRKFAQFCMFPQLFDLHPPSLHPLFVPFQALAERVSGESQRFPRVNLSVNFAVKSAMSFG